MNISETKFAMNGDLAVAYQTIGDGPRDLLWISNFATNIEVLWDLPEMRRWTEYVSSFSRIIFFDQPGTGVSDPISPESPPTLEQWIDSARVVLDAVGSEQATVISVDGGVGCAALFAATYPSRVDGFVAMEGYARVGWDEDYPFGMLPEVKDQIIDSIATMWGTGEFQHALNWDMPWSEEIRQRWARYERLATSPRMVRQLFSIVIDLDVRNILPSIRCPTLVLHHEEDQMIPLDHGRYLADNIPHAKLVVLPGRNAYPFFDDWRQAADEIREFLTGTRGESTDDDRMLATVLFTDIVDSTKRASQIGDRAWRDLLDSHDAIVRSQLERFRGREVKTVGDGFLATFDGPQRAIKCALAVRETVRSLGLEIRAGLHTGECEMRGADVGGIAVHIGARVASEAQASEVLVSSTVKDLVVGSGIVFEDRGSKLLKGVPDEWRLYAVAP
ncbi:MAG TPA: adenylate/guanylate cyclase domain-containing protein [Actinomycetota bacterium]|nr:adenylate/guanylate cyclase domain-containing protein [Actinomycetota bacterium]